MPQLFNVGIKGLIKTDKGVLLLHKSGKDLWECPGGRIEGDEDIQTALQRELERRSSRNRNSEHAKIDWSRENSG